MKHGSMNWEISKNSRVISGENYRLYFDFPVFKVCTVYNWCPPANYTFFASFEFMISLFDLQVSLQNSVTNAFLAPRGRTVSARQ